MKGLGTALEPERAMDLLPILIGQPIGPFQRLLRPLFRHRRNVPEAWWRTHKSWHSATQPIAPTPLGNQ